MKKFVCSLLLASTTMMGVAQDGNHVQMQNVGNLSFIPSWFSNDGLSVFHLFQEDGVNIYDREIALQKNIAIEKQSETYLARKYRTRSVAGATRTSFKLEEELTSTYNSYSESERGQTFAELSKEDKVELIVQYESYMYGSKPDVRNQSDGSVWFLNKSYSYPDMYFAYPYFEFEYPKTGLVLTADGKVCTFAATYEFNYSEWSELKEEYDTLEGAGILSCSYTNMDVNLPSTSLFYVTQTLFNDDAEYEYIRPLYTLKEGPNDVIIEQPSYIESPVTTKNEEGYGNKSLGIKGFSVVSANGDVVKTIEFEDVYDEIGQYTIISGSIFKYGGDVVILQLGDNVYLTFDTIGEDEDYNRVVYKHFYRIDSKTNSIEEAQPRILMNVVPATPKSNETINVNFENKEGCELSLTSVGGKLCYKLKVPAGQNQCHIDTNLSSGTYIVGVKGKSGIAETRKIIVR